MEYKVAIQMFLERKSILRVNMGKAYALIYGTYCNKAMQHRIEEHTEFDLKINNNPVELFITGARPLRGI